MNEDGSVIAYSARRGKEQYCVVGDKLGPPYQTVHPPLVRGNHVAFAAENDKGMFVVVDGRPGPIHESVAGIALDAGGRCAYVVDSSVVIDGKPGRSYDRVTHPTFFPKGSVAYGARRDGRWFVVIDGRESPAEGEISALFPGGYVMEEGRRYRIPGGRMYDWIGWPTKIRDGRIVYFAARANQKILVAADREIELGDCIVWDPHFGDGEVTFVVRRGLEVWRNTIRF